jgi:HEAT repeat protein
MQCVLVSGQRIALVMSLLLLFPHTIAESRDAQSQECDDRIIEQFRIEQRLENLGENPSPVEIDRVLAPLITCNTQVVVRLSTILRDDEETIATRQTSARALGQIGSEAAVAALIREAKRPDSEVREEGLAAIANINPQAQASVALLLRNIARTTDQVLLQALAYGLGRVSAHADEDFAAIVTEFRAALGKQNQFTQDTARTLFVSALAQEDADQQSIVPFLLTTLEQDPNEFVRAAAVEVLGQVKPDAEIAVPKFIRILGREGETGYVKEKVAGALGQIGADAIDPVMASMEQQKITSYWWAVTLVHFYNNPNTRERVTNFTSSWIAALREDKAPFEGCRLAEYLSATDQTEAFQETLSVLGVRDGCIAMGGLQSGGRELVTVARNATRPVPVICRFSWIRPIVGRCR